MKRFARLGSYGLLTITSLLVSGQIHRLPASPTPDTQPAAAVRLEGQLLGIDEKPMAGVKILGCTRNLDQYGVKLFYDSDEFYVATTDEQGRFSLSLPKPKYNVLVFTNDGYVVKRSKDLVAPVTLKLTPWGKLEGVVTIGNKPAPAGTVVDINYGGGIWDRPYVGLYLERQKTDREGRFVIERAFAGDYSVRRSSAAGLGRPAKVTVLPGKLAHVDVHVVGRPVIGQITLPQGYTDESWQFDASVQLRNDLPDLQLSKEVMNLASAQRNTGFAQSPRGAQRIAATQHRIEVEREWSVQVNRKNGSFHIDEMSPGAYALRVFFFRKGEKGIDHEHLADSADYLFTVSPIPGDVSMDALDVGVCPLAAVGALNAGQVAPDFAFPTVDGPELTLSQFKGKVILIDFWTVWCPCCLTDISKLRAIQDEYGKNSNFIMISLNMDAQRDKLKAFVVEHQMTWTQGILGPGEESWVRYLYGVTGYPSMLVIGADGEVRGEGSTVETIKPTLIHALADAHR